MLNYMRLLLVHFETTIKNIEAGNVQKNENKIIHWKTVESF